MKTKLKSNLVITAANTLQKFLKTTKFQIGTQLAANYELIYKRLHILPRILGQLFN